MRRLLATVAILGAGIPLMLWALDNALTTLSKYGIVKVKPLTIQINPEIIAGAVSLMLLATTTTIMVVVVIRSRKLFGLIPLSELNRHVVVLGPTGSGKTTVAKSIIEKALRSGVEQVIVIDWKGEYHFPGATIIRKLTIWDVPGEGPREKALIAVEMLREISRDVVEVTPASSLLLLKILEEEYRRGVPTTEKVLKILEKYAEIAQREHRLAEANMYLALARRLYLFLVDEERSAENVEGNPQLIIYDLKDLPSVYLKNLYASFVIINVYRKAYASAGADAMLRSLLIAEETQNYIRHRRPEEPPTMSERLVYELRGLGVGAVLICPDPELIPTPVLRDVGTIIATSPDSLPRFALERYLFRASLEEAEDTLKKLKKAKATIVYRGQLHFLRRLPRPPKLKPRVRPKGDRMGVTHPWAGGRSLRAWPILPHRSPGILAPKVIEVKEGLKKKPVIEVKVAEEGAKVEPKVVEVVEPKITEEPLKLEEEECEEEPEIEVGEPETAVTEPTEEKKVGEPAVEVKEIEEELTEEMPLEESKPEPAPEGPPIPSTLPYRGSLCPAGRTATSGRSL